MPVLLGLSANSPFWRADATGLASTRTPIFRAFPRVGIPPTYEDWEDYERRIEFMIKAGVIEDYTYLWHDVRPHPNFGTVEIRVMDSQTHIEHSLGSGRARAGAGQRAGRALRRRQASCRATRSRCSTRTSGWPPATGSRASSSTCRARTGSRPARWRGGCSTGCASTASDLGSATELEAVEDLLEPRQRRRPPGRRLRGQPRSARGHGRDRGRDRRLSAGASARERLAARASEQFYNRFVSTGGPDLFVICKSCGSEVSPYITECPYCGNRLRKRAPKLDRDGPRRREAPAPAAAAAADRGCAATRSRGSGPTPRPYATIVLVAARAGRQPAVAHRRWSAINELDDLRQAGVALVAAVHRGVHLQQHRLRVRRRSARSRLFGWLLERRHGPLVGARAVPGRRRRRAGRDGGRLPVPIAMGGNGAALALLCAWAVPDLLALRAGEEIEGTCSATAVIARRGRADAAGGAARRAGSPTASAWWPGSRSGCRWRGWRTLTGRPALRRTLIVPGGPVDQPPDHRARDIVAAPRRRAPPPAGRPRSSRRTPASAAPRATSSANVRELLGVRAVAPRPAGDRALVGVGQQLEHAVDRRHRGGVDLGGERRWPAPARAGGRAGRTRSRRSVACAPASRAAAARVAVQRGHHLHRLGQRRVEARA